MKPGRLTVLVVAIGIATGCGSKETPFSPTVSTGTSSQLVAPTTFITTSQQIRTSDNVLSFSWVSPETSFTLVIGSASGASDVLPPTTVTGNTFTWTSPRPAKTYYAKVAAKRGDSTSPFSDELVLTVVDIRNMVEAMFFHTGPMSDANENGRSDVAVMWPDGTRLRVLVSPDVPSAGANAQTFAEQYAALTNGAITATVSAAPDTMQTAPTVLHPESILAEFTIGIRLQTGFCPTGALGCANYGPAPSGTNRSMITLPQSGGLFIGATAHEMGHAYGMGHIQTPAAGRAEFRFMMNSNSGAEQMTDAEKLAVTFARGLGLRPAMTRSAAIGIGAINPS